MLGAARTHFDQKLSAGWREDCDSCVAELSVVKNNQSQLYVSVFGIYQQTTHGMQAYRGVKGCRDRTASQSIR